MAKRALQFAPVTVDDDPLSQSIEQDQDSQDDKWDLHDAIDADKLAEFWDEAVRELGGLEPEDSKG